MPAPQFPVNTYRYDPYQNWRFRVKWDGNYVAAVNRVTGLTRSTEVVRYRSGGDAGVVRVMPGQTSYQPITLEQGVTHDVAFEQWANKVWDYTNSTKGDNATEIVSLKDFRKDIIIEIYNEAGQKVIAYNVYRAWVSEFKAISDLEGTGNAVLIQSITIQNEGWERDTSVKPPTEPSFTLPAST